MTDTTDPNDLTPPAVADVETGGTEPDFSQSFDDFSAARDGNDHDDNAAVAANDTDSASFTAPAADVAAETDRQSATAQSDNDAFAQQFSNLNGAFKSSRKELAEQYESGELSFPDYEEAKRNLQESYDSAKTGIFTRKQELDGLNQKHPNWQTEGNSPEFIQWLGQQPAALQKMARQFDTDNYDYLLTSFKNQRGGSEADRLKQQRASRLKNSVGIKGGKSDPANAMNDDFDSAFEEFSKKRDKRA